MNAGTDNLLFQSFPNYVLYIEVLTTDIKTQK